MGVLTQRGEDDEGRGEIRIAGLDGLDVGAPEELVYELDDWDEPGRLVLRERLETLGVPHRWEGQALVVAAANDAWVERVMDQVEEDLGRLDEPQEQVAYDLVGWDDVNREQLFDLLDADGIAFGMDGDELFVGAIDEQRVDEVIDSILGPEDGSAPAVSAGPDVMGEIFVAADRLSNDPLDREGALSLVASARATAGSNPPYGMDKVWWDGVLANVDHLLRLLDVDEPDQDAVAAEAVALRDALRPYV